MFLNKIGLCVERGRHWRCFEGSNAAGTVWAAASTLGAVDSGAIRRFEGVLQTYVSAPRREKKGTRFFSETTRVYPILSISPYMEQLYITTVVYQPRSVKQKYIWRSCILPARYINRGQQSESIAGAAVYQQQSQY